MQDLNEKKLHSEQLVDGQLLKVYRDRVRLPNGGETIREWIDHPGASAVVPLFADGSTMLVRQFRYPPRRTFLEVPAGKMDRSGEKPAEVAARELEEETGWRAETFSRLGALYPCIGYSNEIIYLYLAEGLTKGRRSLSEGEFMDVVAMGFVEALALVAKGEIVDMKSAAALLYAEAYLERRSEAYEGEKLR
jgi:ADP-ribose pyrophosphatase